MATYTRRNAWNQNGTFNNPDLLWYARGVGVMQARALKDTDSWWFFAAIHGQYIAGTSFPGWGFIPGPPQVPTSPLPPQNLRDIYWDQCQHQSWYFPPWHRGYLIALEAQLRAAVISLGGPNNWALPYWNYFGPQNEYKIPPAFAQPNLPDGTPNPLYVKARYGPQNNGNIYIAIPPVSQTCQTNTIYTGSNAATPRPGYGGPSTRFSHGGGVSGNLEKNPHNNVHTQIGGVNGLMSDPDTAALDPVFYLHHCNIDRMWAAWNAAGNSNPASQNWLNGPASQGDRKFAMPMPGGTSWVFTPAGVNDLSQLDYDYDTLAISVGPPLPNRLTQRLSKLGMKSSDITLEANMDAGTNSELVGANDGTFKIDSSGARTTVKFDKESWNKVSASLESVSSSKLPDNVYLQIENVKGNMDGNILTVTVNQQLAGHISLFGLRKASMKDGEHGGTGLTFLLDITDVVDNMHLENALDLNSLDVTILPSNEIPAGEEITVGRVSLYREGEL